MFFFFAVFALVRTACLSFAMYPSPPRDLRQKTAHYTLTDNRLFYETAYLTGCSINDIAHPGPLIQPAANNGLVLPSIITR
jgi:hypothetical protein